MVAFLAARATPGVEMVETGQLSSFHFFEQLHGYFDVSLDEGVTHSRAGQFDDPAPSFSLSSEYGHV